MSVIRPPLDDGEEIRRHPALGLLVAAGATGVNLLAEPFVGHTPTLIIYLAALILAGPSLDRAGVFLQAGASLIAWDFLFTRPRFSFTMLEKEDVALAVLFLVATVAIARLARLARSGKSAASRETERLRLLHLIAKELASDKERRPRLEAALRDIGDAYEAAATLLVFTDGPGAPPPLAYGEPAGPDDIDEARRDSEERRPFHRFVDIPERGLVQNFVLPFENGAGVLRLKFRDSQPGFDDRTETLRLLTYLLISAEGSSGTTHSAAKR